MRALTVRQPWCSAITYGSKRVENRSKAVAYRGPVALHAGLAVECSPWAMYGQYHWQLANVRPLREPVPCKGMLGLWRLPEDVERAVRACLEWVVAHPDGREASGVE